MDIVYFLKERTKFIRFYFDESVKPFADIRHRIEEELPPYDDPPYSEDPEPAFLEEWMDTATAEQIVGLTCVSLLSDSLKLYFHALEKRVIGFTFNEDEKKLFKKGFVAAYIAALSDILSTDWSDCPVDLAVIEQIVLVRNRGQHGGDLTSFDITHDEKMLEKYPKPFFAIEDEQRDWKREEGSLSWFLMPNIEVARDNLFNAIEQVELLGDWIESKMDQAWEWRSAQRSQT